MTDAKLAASSSFAFSFKPKSKSNPRPRKRFAFPTLSRTGDRSLCSGIETLETRRVFAALLLNETIHETIGTAGDQDLFEFALASPTRLYVDALATGSSIDWSLTTASGTPLYSESLANRAPVMDLAAGNYQLSFSESGSSTVAYAFRLLDLSAAPLVSLGATNNDSLSPSSSTQAYRLSATAGDVFNFDTETAEPRSAAWRLIAPHGNTLFDAGLSSDINNLRVTATGIYTLLVEGYIFDAGTVDYQFDVDFLGNTLINPYPGSPVTLGNTITGSLATANEVDAYAFTLNAATNLYVDTLLADGSFQWSLKGPDGNILSSRNLANDYYFAGSAAVWNAPAGNYQLSVDSNDGSTGNYALRVLNLSAAPLIAADITVAGTLAPGSSATAYRLPVTAGQRLHLSSSTTATNGTWRVLSPSGQNLAGSNFSSNLEDIPVAESGLVTILIEGYPFDSTDQAYSFKVQLPIDGDASLTLNTVVSSALTTPGEVDYYRFHLPSDTLVQFDTLVNLPNTRWLLRDAPGNQIQSRQLSNDWYFSTNVGTIALTAGSYTLAIDGDGDQTGSYSFQLLNLALGSALTPGALVTGAIDPGTETNIYRFTAAAGAQFYFDSHSGNTNNALWRLVDSTSRTLTSNYLSQDMDTISLPLAGEYYLSIEGYIEDPAVNYSFTVQPVLNLSTVPLVLGATTSGNISVPGERDVYTFQLNESRRLQFDALSQANPLRWRLAREDGTTLVNRAFDSDISFGGNNTLNLVPGSYTLSIDPGDDTTGTYEFRLLDLATAESIDPGTTIARSLSPARETDIYRFTAAEDVLYYVDSLTVDTANSYWRVLDPLGRSVVINGLSNDLGLFRTTAAGEYTLLVEGYFYDELAINYSFNVRPVTLPTPTPLVFGTTYSDTLSVAGQFHQFTFSVSTDTYVLFDALTSPGNVFWSLQGPTTVVSSRNMTSDLSGETYKLIPGSYTLIIDGAGDQTGDYAFRLFDLASASVPAVTPGTPQAGSLNPFSQTDLYRFTGMAGETFYLDSQMPASHPSTSAQWNLIDPAGRTIFSSSVFSDSDVIRLPLTGQYTLAVSGYFFETQATDYAFNVQQLSDAAPIAITFGDTYAGAVALTGEVDRYTFNVASTTADEAQFVFDALTSADNLRWILAGPLGVVSSQTLSAIDVPFLHLYPGDYTLSIDGNGDNVGGYSFRVLSGKTGPTVAVDTLTSGQLAPGGSAAIYLLPVNAGDKFDFLGSASNSNLSAWQLIDPVGRTVFYENAQSSRGNLELSMTGDYRLVVKGPLNVSESINYEFTVDFLSNTPPDTPSGTAITIGSVVPGSLSVGGEQDAFLFTLNNPTQLVFDAFTSQNNLLWTLFGPTGVVANNDFYDDGDLAIPSLIPGDYRLVVYGISDSITGNYSFQLLDLAAGSPIDTNSLIEGQLSPGNETNLYRFTGTAGTQFYFDSKLSNSNICYWQLIDPAGRVLAAEAVSRDLELITLPLTGVYKVMVYGRFDNEVDVSYAFRVQSVLDTPPTALTFGTTYNGNIGVTGQTDRYSFSLSQDSLVSFDVLTVPPDFVWYIEGPLGSTTNRSLDDEATLSLSAGDYQLVIDANVDAIGAYAFRLLASSTATAMTPGTPLTSSLVRGNQIDLYRFTAAAGSQFFVDSQTSNDGTARWEIFDPIGQSLTSGRLRNDLGILQTMIGGEYLVLVRGNDNTPDGQAYTFNIQPLVANPSVPLTLNTTQPGAIGVPGEQDRYTFTLTQEMTITFDATISISGLTWKIDSLNGTSLSPIGFDSDTTNTGASSPYKLAAGDYVITVYSDSDTTGAYEFRLTDPSSASPIGLGTAVNVNLTPGNQTKMYSVNVNAGNRLYLETTFQNSTIHTWSIVDPLGNRIAYGALHQELETAPLAFGGTYWIVVEGYFYESNPLIFSFTAHASSDSIPQAISVGSTVSGNIAVPGQRQTFTFSLTERSLVIFDTLSVSSDALSYSLVGPAGPAGPVVDARNLNSDYYFSSNDMPVRLIPGAYQITVDGAGAGLGTYQFRLLDLASALSISRNHLITGTLGPSRQTELFSFTASVGERLFLASQSSNTLNSLWRLIDPRGVTLRSSSLSSDLGGISLAIAGRYTVAVESYALDQANVPFSFVVQTVDPQPANTTLAPAVVVENLPSGTVVGLLTTSDINSASNPTYTLVAGAGDTDNALFTIVNNELRTAVSLDFETKNVFTVRVRTVDNVGLLFERVFTINVSNNNEQPSSISLSNATLGENLPAGSVVGNVSGTDPDVGDNLIFSLPSGLGDNSAFELAGNALQARTKLDFETKSTYTITLRATDTGGLSIDREFTISVINLPELAGPVVIGDGTPGRSLIRQVVVDFDGDMIVDSGAFAIAQRTLVNGNPIFTSVTTQVDLTTLPNGKTRATLTFSGEFTRAGGALVDGYYQLTIDSSKVRDRVSGVSLDGDRNGVAGGDFALGSAEADNFFALFGDTNGDGLVGVDEFGEFRSAFGKLSADPGYNPLFDFNGDGAVGVSDFGQFRSRFGKAKMTF